MTDRQQSPRAASGGVVDLDTYWMPFRQTEESVRDRLVQGRRHLFEANMKEDRRTHGHPVHTARPWAGPA